MAIKKVKHKTTGKIGTVDFGVSLESFPPKYEVKWESGSTSYEFKKDLKILK